MRPALTFAAAVAIAYGALVLLLYVIQDRLVYFPARDIAATPKAIGATYEDVWLTTEDGVRLHGWFIPAPEARGVVLHLHGNGGNISHRLERIRQFRDFGFAVFLIDYRGYGRSEGKTTEEGTYRDARAAWRHLTETRRVDPSHIVIHGESLGGAVATKLASEQRPRALIVESSFVSMKELGAELYPWLPVRWISRFDYPSGSNLAEVRAPVLIVHSRDDEIIPFRHGEALFAAAVEPKQLLIIRGDHNNGFLLSGKLYEAGIRDFLYGNSSARSGSP